MNLEKAKTQLKIHKSKISPALRPGLQHALEIGIAGLNRISQARKLGIALATEPLPGETEE